MLKKSSKEKKKLKSHVIDAVYVSLFSDVHCPFVSNFRKKHAIVMRTAILPFVTAIHQTLNALCNHLIIYTSRLSE